MLSLSMVMGGTATAIDPGRARRIGDLVREASVTVTPGTTVDEARRLVRETPTGYLPVVDRGLLVGIVCDRDLRTAGGPSAPVTEVMTRTVFVLSPETPVRDAARVFRRRRFGAMPVLEGRELCGMVARDAVLEALEGAGDPRGVPLDPSGQGSDRVGSGP